MEFYDLVIIGSGPAGYSAAIYAGRANIKTVLFEGLYAGIAGGQLMTTTLVENYPGFPKGIMGPDLMMNMKQQALNQKVQILSQDVKNVDCSSHPFLITGSKGEIKAKAIIVATGATAKTLDVPGKKEFWQKGVSTCAVCDGAMPIFRDKDLYVIGGGNSAVEEALFLTKFAKKVFIVHRRDELRAFAADAEKVKNHSKIEILFNSELVEILGDKIVNKIKIKNNQTNEVVEKDAAGVFFAIGHTPNTAFLNNQIKLDQTGFIITEGKSSKTNIEGVFAAGDVQDPTYRQAVTSVGSGCIAFIDAERWLEKKGLLE